MPLRVSTAALASLALAAAADIRGVISIDKKLTPRVVTAAAGMYQRGPAVDLGPDIEEDPLAFERAQVAVYLEVGSKSAGASAGAPSKVVAMVHNVFSLSKPRISTSATIPRDKRGWSPFPRRAW